MKWKDGCGFITWIWNAAWFWVDIRGGNLVVDGECSNNVWENHRVWKLPPLNFLFVLCVRVRGRKRMLVMDFWL